MKAGKLDQLITLQSKSVTRDAMGGEVVTWVTQNEVWAEYQPLSGREYFAAKIEQAESVIRFKIRRGTSVTTAWRLLWKAVAYDINDVVPIDGKHEEFHLMCQTQQNA